VRASLVDQYGDAVSGAKIRFWSNADNADVTGSGDDEEPVTWNNGLGGLDRYEFSDNADQTAIEADNDIDTGDVKTDDDGDAIAIGAADVDVHNYADERTTNRRGVATKSYSRDAEEDLVETIHVAFNYNPDDGDTDPLDNDDPANNPDFADIGTGPTGDNPDPYWIEDDTEFGSRALDLRAEAVHYWATEANNRTDSPTEALTAVVVDTDANLVVVTDNKDGEEEPMMDDKVQIVIYDSNDQFNTMSDRVTMSYFESTLTDKDDADTIDTDERSLLTFELQEDPEDEVNRITNTNGANPSAPGRCVVVS
jgi:hypothetical protein